MSERACPAMDPRSGTESPYPVLSKTKEEGNIWERIFMEASIPFLEKTQSGMKRLDTYGNSCSLTNLPVKALHSGEQDIRGG